MKVDDEMILTVDVGNSSIGYGIFQKGNLIFHDVVSSRYDSELDAIIAKLKENIQTMNLDISKIRTGIIVSVVPSLTMIVQMAFKNVFKIKLVQLDNTFKHDVNLKIDDVSELGGDLLADLVALKRDYSYPSLLVDLGTVTKTLLLDEHGDFVSCLFSPGPKSCVRSLGDEAALLPNLNRIEVPKDGPYARNTEDAIITGVFYGTIASIEGVANIYEKELQKPLTRVISGGFSKVIKDALPSFCYDNEIVLKGLYYLYLSNPDKFPK